MSKFYKHKKYSNYKKPLTKQESFGWMLVSIIFTIFFIFYLLKGFVINCIFEWPIRWDVNKCWTEQIDPASKNAAEKAVNFVP